MARIKWLLPTKSCARSIICSKGFVVVNRLESRLRSFHWAWLQPPLALAPAVHDRCRDGDAMSALRDSTDCIASRQNTMWIQVIKYYEKINSPC